MSESQEPPEPPPPPRRQLHPAAFRMRRPSDPDDYYRFDAAEPGGAADSEADVIILRPPRVKPRTDDANQKPESSALATGAQHADLVDSSNQTTVSGKRGKATSGMLASGSNAGSPGDNLAQTRSRYDSSLGLLTKNVINLLKQAEDGILDLNKAARSLQVKKRRMYDITNVLEGIGLIEKVKNGIKWKGPDASRPEESDESTVNLEVELQNLTAEEAQLDEEIREMQEKLKGLSEDENNKRFLFITEEDIKSIPSFQNETLIAVKAPHGTKLEVPDPDEAGDDSQRRYRMFLQSTTGPVHVYILSQSKDTDEEIHGANAPLDLPSTSGMPENQDAATLLEDYTGNNMELQAQDASDEEIHGANAPSDLPSTSGMPENQDAATLLEDYTGNNMELQAQDASDFVDGILNNVPSDVDVDVDYWLLSEPDDFSITERWLSESEVNLNQPTYLDQDSVAGQTTLQQPHSPSDGTGKQDSAPEDSSTLQQSQTPTAE